MKSLRATALRKSEHHPEYVHVSPAVDPYIYDKDFATLGFFISPGSARILAADLMKAADEAEGKPAAQPTE